MNILLASAGGGLGGSAYMMPFGHVEAVTAQVKHQPSQRNFGTVQVAVINNGNLGMVKQLQEIHYGGRYSNVDLATHSRHIPDFVQLSEALGCVTLCCERGEDVDAVIARARAINDRPVVIDFIAGDDALVWTMIAAGASNDQIMAARGIRPLFDDTEEAAETATIHELLEGDKGH